MKFRVYTILLFLMFSGYFLRAQMPSCPSPYVYMDGPGGIYAYNPSQPLSASNPFSIGIPNGGGGLTLMPNINGGTLSPTFYSVIGGNYSFWNGVSWQSTGHGTGNGAAVNLGGCNSAIYNLVGSTGQVYVYNGTGTGSLLTTINGFNGGGPYDLVTDCFCNFYVLNTTTPNQNLTLYSPAGVAQCTYSLVNMPNASAGGGFAVIGNQVIVKNNLNNGLFVGNISGSTVTFTNIVGFPLGPGDFASCPVCNPTATLNSAYLSGGVLGCTTPTLNVIANTTASPVFYAWSGPGIVGPATNSVVVVNSSGIYTCVISANGCPASQLTLTTTILSNVIPVYASITPSGNICMDANVPIPLLLSSSSPSSTSSWTGPGFPGTVSGFSLLATAPGLYSVAVTDMLTGCIGATTVNVILNPTVNLSVSNPTLCARPILGSPASFTLTPSGAPSYSLLPSVSFSTSAPNGTVMPCTPIAPFANTVNVVTATLVGANGICLDSATVNFTIYPNPGINVTPQNPNVCIGNSVLLVAFGASQYTWLPVPGLSTYTSDITLATPSVNSTYTVIGSSNGCFAQPATVSVNVLPLPVFSVSPSNSLICLGSQASFSALGNAATYSWSPAFGLASTTGSQVVSSASSTVVYQVIGTLNTCTSTASSTLFVMNPPVMSMALNQSTMCAHNFNGSTNSVQVLASGANTYTLINGPNYSVTSPNGPAIQIFPAGPPSSAPSVITLTLLGTSSVCQMSTTQTLMVLPNPTISVAPSFTSICPGKSQIITAQGADTYTWSPLSNLNTYTGNLVISITPSVSTLYSVVGSSMGCLSNSKNASVNLLPIPQFSITPNTSTVCAGNSVTLSALGTAQSYFWSPSTALSANTGSQVVSSPNAYVTYTILGTLNNCTNTAVASVSAIPVPIVNATATEYTVCSGGTTLLKASGATNYSWTPAYSLNTPVGQNVFASPLSNTTYTLRGYNGVCTGSNTIQIFTVPRPTMSITSPYNQVCIGYSLPILVEGAQYYSWSPIFGLSSSTGSLVHASPLVTTNYTITGTNTNGTVNCTQMVSYSVMVLPNVIPSTSGSAFMCQGERVTLSASGGNTYQWSPPEGLSATNLQAVVANPTVTTVYTVDVSYNTFCGNTATLLVEVYPKPSVFAGRDTTFNLDEPVYINAIGTGTITWISGENIECPVCLATRVYPSSDECYVVQTVNEYGCVAQDMVCIEITNDFNVYIPNTFTPNNDGLNDVFYAVGTGISNFRMDIFDRWGKLIFSSNNQLEGWSGEFKGERSEIGAYTYKIEYTGLNGKRYEKSGQVTLMR